MRGIPPSILSQGCHQRVLHPLLGKYQRVPHPLPRGCLGVLHPLPYLITPGKGCSTPRQPPPSPGRGCTIPGTSSIEVAAPPGIPSVRGCRTPGTHFGTLRGVRLCKTTDVLEFSSTLMEQRTLDARRVLLIKTIFRCASIS